LKSLPPVKPDSTCCIIYTSGTTGKPKGVCIEHKSILNEAYYVGTQILTSNQLQKTAFTTSICFDACFEEIFVPLLFGGTVVVAESMLDLWEKQDPFRDITFIIGTPSSIQ